MPNAFLFRFLSSSYLPLSGPSISPFKGDQSFFYDHLHARVRIFFLHHPQISVIPPCLLFFRGLKGSPRLDGIYLLILAGYPSPSFVSCCPRSSPLKDPILACKQKYHPFYLLMYHAPPARHPHCSSPFLFPLLFAVAVSPLLSFFLAI